MNTGKQLDLEAPCSAAHPPKRKATRESRHRLQHPVAALRLILFFTLLLAAATFIVLSIHWPLVGDSAQIHYIAFLLDHGMAPYRVAQDMNMPGAILLSWLVAHTLGPGSLAWRIFDLLTCAAVAAAMAYLAGSGRRLAGVSAGLLLLLLHGADGLNDTGERDLSMTALLLLAYVALFAILRRPSLIPTYSKKPNNKALPAALLAFLLGLTSAATATIKPTTIPLLLILIGTSIFSISNLSGTTRREKTLLLTATVTGLLLPLCAVLFFLHDQTATHAFLHNLVTVVPFYAGLDHRSLPFLLTHSVSPLMPVVLCWVLLLALSGLFRLQPANPRPRNERRLLLLGALFGLLSYIVQAKGFPYYRYPLLAFLLLLMATDFDRVLKDHPATIAAKQGSKAAHKTAAVLAILALIYAALWLAPLSAWRAHGFLWQDQQFIHSLTRDLQTLEARNNQVQCIDSIAGCGNTLLRLRLVQTTGLLSDFFIFGPQPNPPPAMREARARFQTAVAQRPPKYLVITARLHLDPQDPGHWTKLTTWPWFQNWLKTDYTLVLTRKPTRPALWWSRPEWPAAYRIYVRKPEAPKARLKLARAARLPTQTEMPLNLPQP